MLYSFIKIPASTNVRVHMYICTSTLFLHTKIANYSYSYTVHTAYTYIVTARVLCDGGRLCDGLVDPLDHNPVTRRHSVDLDAVASLRDP